MTIKTFIGGLSLAAALTATAWGSTVSCQIGGDAFVCGGLIFSNLQTVNQDGGAGGIALESATFDPATGQVVFVVDPNLQSSEDEGFMFQVTGTGIGGIDLAVGGINGSVDETACRAPIQQSGPLAYLCQSGTLLGNIDAFSGGQLADSSFGPQGAIYVYADVLTGSGGQNSVTDFSFQVVPEPASLLLISGGLLFLGLVRRKAA